MGKQGQAFNNLFFTRDINATSLKSFDIFGMGTIIEDLHTSGIWFWSSDI